jgi:hypothetical protein
MAARPTDEEIHEALANAGGNKSAAAKALGLTRNAFRYYLENCTIKPFAAGRIRHRQSLAKEGPGVYLLTCAQANTYIHPKFLENLKAYRAHRSAELHISRFTYAKQLFAKPELQKADIQSSDTAPAWYDPAIKPYVSDEPILLAPTLMWCAEMNTLPTAVRPLSGLESYSGEASGIFPHAKLALESVATSLTKRAKMNYTTGACTQRNYIEKKAGLKADFHHVYGACVVEVAKDGRWWVRQINATDDGSFFDLWWHVKDGKVRRVKDSVHAINWGDIHVAQIDPQVASTCWGPNGVLNTLKPRFQIFNDLHDQLARNHHETYETRIEKWLTGKDCVRSELVLVGQFLKMSNRPWCEGLVVSSNHDRHGERWLDEADFRKDPKNAEMFLAAQLDRLRALKNKKDWDFLSWGIDYVGAGTAATFLPRDSDYLLLGKIEVAWHGDEGPNGTRGSPIALAKAATRANIGHSHSACIMDGVYQAGVCQLYMDYNHGPSSWSVSHILTYRNAKRCILTDWGGDCWLPELIP